MNFPTNFSPDLNLTKKIALLLALYENIYFVDNVPCVGEEEPLLHDATTVEDAVTEEYENNFSYNGADYLVLDNDEADTAWDESLENYIEECILPEIPECYQNYFDKEAWKVHAKHDGRGHSLSGYDGYELKVNFDRVLYCIFRTN